MSTRRQERQRALKAGIVPPPQAPAVPRLTTMSFVVDQRVVEMLEEARKDFNEIRADAGKEPLTPGDFLVKGIIAQGLRAFDENRKKWEATRQHVVLAGANQLPPPMRAGGFLVGAGRR